MPIHLRGVCLLALGLALLGLERAAGQYGTTIESMVNRPSDRGPSAFIGGRFTSQRFRPLSSTRMSTPMFGQSQYQFRSRVQPRSRRGTGLTGPQLGLMSGLGAPGPMSFYGGGARGTQSLSGMGSARRLFLPPPNMPIRFVPSIMAHEHTPRPESTPFQDLLGLEPRPEERTGEMLPLPMERLRARTEERAMRSLRVAMELFKAGTIEARNPRTEQYENCPDCPDKMARARNRLDMARLLDPDAHLPLMLMVHCCLEDDQPTLAMNMLLQAYDRQPELTFSRSFVFLADDAGDKVQKTLLEQLEEWGYEAAASTDETWPMIGVTALLAAEHATELRTMPGVEAVRDFVDFFGDVGEADQQSEHLTAQMRRYWYYGDANATSADALAIQAYCAWRLGDSMRAASTIVQLEDLVWDEKNAPSQRLLSFISSLRAELERRG